MAWNDRLSKSRYCRDVGYTSDRMIEFNNESLLVSPLCCASSTTSSGVKIVVRSKETTPIRIGLKTAVSVRSVQIKCIVYSVSDPNRGYERTQVTLHRRLTSQPSLSPQPPPPPSTTFHTASATIPLQDRYSPLTLCPADRILHLSGR